MFAASLGKSKKRKGKSVSDEEWFVLDAMPPSKTGSHCGDSKSKIAAQLVHDGFGYKYDTICKIYMTKWCKEASGNISKSNSMLIEHGKKKWWLSIVKNKPENIPEVLMYTNVSETRQDKNKKWRKKA